MSLQRCGWVSADPDYINYHDNEWGIPAYQRNYLFEMLCLEGQQAGLSWITILKKRQAYRHHFHQFIPEKVAQMDELVIDQLMLCPDLIRNRLKLQAIVKNAKALLALEAQGETFSDFIWRFVGNQPQIQSYADYRDAPKTTPAAVAMSGVLKKLGFNFVGPIICHSYMQACGLIIDHQIDCFRYFTKQ